MVLSLSVMMFFADTKKAIGLYSFGSGVFLGLMYLTREEDIWILSCFVFVAVLSTLRNMIREGLGSTVAVMKSTVIRSLCIISGILVFVGPVLLANHMTYGRAIVSEFRAPEFNAAIGAMTRVGNIHPSGYVPVTNEAMQAILENIPAAAALRPHWPAIASGWSNFGARLLPESPNELAGGWFIWAFRDAVALAGYYQSPSDAKNFYTELANEVNAACENGILTCRERRDTLRPALTADRFPDLFAASLDALVFTLGLSTNPITAPRSPVVTDNLMSWNKRIGPVVTDDASLRIAGWIAHRSVTPALKISGVASDCAQKLTVSPGPDVIAHYEDLGLMGVQAVRFEFRDDTDEMDCGALTVTSASDFQTISLSSLAPGSIEIGEAFWGYLDTISTLRLNPSPTEGARLTIVVLLAAMAGFIVPILVVTSTSGLVLSLFFLKSQPKSDWLIVLSVGAAVLVTGRSAIIGYIHITSWHAINSGYLGAAYPFVIIYAVVGTAVLLNVTRKMLNRSRLHHSSASGGSDLG